MVNAEASTYSTEFTDNYFEFQNYTPMVNLQLIHSFLKDPMTDKLFRKYITDAKARRVFDMSVRLIEITMVAAPLVVSAVNGIREMAKPGSSRRSGSKLRRALSAVTA